VRAGRITAAWAEQKAVREIMVFLHSHGVGTARAVRIFKTYGADAIQVMSENPYRLARDIRGIGFKTADAIAMKLGIEKTAMVRVRAGTQSLQHVKAGALRLPAVTEAKRSSLLPDVPTVAETVPGYEMSVWYGAFGPAGMPKDIVRKLHAEISRILFLPEVRRKMADIAVEVAKSTPEELGVLVRDDAERWGRIIRELRIAVQ
jgi:tripartite-type tricarboxylate transporter receptor subunit TctC